MWRCVFHNIWRSVSFLCGNKHAKWTSLNIYGRRVLILILRIYVKTRMFIQIYVMLNWAARAAQTAPGHMYIYISILRHPGDAPPLPESENRPKWQVLSIYIYTSTIILHAWLPLGLSGLPWLPLGLSGLPQLPLGLSGLPWLPLGLYIYIYIYQR